MQTYKEKSSHLEWTHGCTQKQRPLGSDPVVIFGQFPEKGAKKAKGEGYFLYHRDTFLGDFNGKSDQQILSQTTKMFPNIQNLKRVPETSEPERLKRAKPAKFVKTAEDATQQIIEMGVQEMMLEVMLEVTALATKTVILQEQAEEEKKWKLQHKKRTTYPLWLQQFKLWHCTRNRCIPFCSASLLSCPR